MKNQDLYHLFNRLFDAWLLTGDTKFLDRAEAVRAKLGGENNMKKYEFTGEEIEFNGRTLKRIKRLSDGLVGGWIEIEENLDQDGDCFVFDNAKVFDNARVSDNAQVFDDAKIFGNAMVYGNALVYENARVSGDAGVFDNAWVLKNAQVYGEADICGCARIGGDLVVCGKASIFSNR